jgi:hypothetical protein
MKLLSAMLMLIFSMSVIFAQDIRILVKPKDSKFWGYADEKGNVTLAKYLYCEPFSEDGFAVVYSSARKEYRVLDRFCNEITTEITGFDLKDILSYYPGQFNGGMLVVRKSNKWGAIDTSGRLIVQMKWTSLLDFENKYGIGKINNQFYIINARTQQEFLLNEEIIEMKSFHEGLAPAKFTNGFEGYIDTTGNVVIKPQYLQVGYFEHGIAWAQEFNGLIGFIDRNGNWVIGPKFTSVKSMDHSSGLARVEYEGKWLYVGLNDELMDFGMSEITDDFHDGLARGRKDGLYGFYNSKGEWIIKPQFIGARDFKNGYAAVSLNSGDQEIWGFIDTSGKFLIEPKFRNAKDAVILK